MYLFNGQIGGSQPYRHAVHVESFNGGQARLLVRSATTRGAIEPLPEGFGYVTGTGAELFINGGQFRTSLTTPAGFGVLVRDGGLLRILSSTFRGFETGILVENAGAPPKLYGYNVGLESNTRDVVLDHPGVIGTLQGTFSHQKLIVNGDLPNMSMSFMDVEDAGMHIVGKFNLAPTVDQLTDITDLITQTAPMGLIEGGVVTRGSGTTVNVTGGSGYLRNANGFVQHTIFTGGIATLTPGTTPYIYINAAGALQASTIAPDLVKNILLARVMVGASSILLIGDISLRTPNIGNTIDLYLRNTIGPVFVSGSIVTENATTARALDVSSGEYWFGTNIRKPDARTALMFFDTYKVGAQVNLVPKTVVPNDTITDPSSPTGLKPMTPGYFTKHALYQSGSGSDLLFILSHASEEFATIEEVYAAGIPIPVLEPAGTPFIAALIVQQGVTNLVDIIDIRPKHFRAGAGGASGGTSDHGELLGLGDDDHTQYLLANGGRAMIGNLNLGSNSIVNVGLVNGLDLTAHASRHQPNGADPLLTGPAVTVSPSTTNGTGTSNLLARADHTHALFGVQPLNPRLTNFLAAPATGLLTATGPNTWAARSLTSTTGTVTITRPDGVDGNIDINLTARGVQGTYSTVTVDEYGSVISGTTTTNWTALTGTPTTISGYGITDAQPLDSDLTALANSGGTGFYIRSGDGASVTRSLVQPAQGLTITNADGIAGSPTFALANDLAALEGFTGTGIPVRAGTDTWALRSLTAPAAGLTISNATGVAGNPTFALANDLAALEGLSTIGLAVRTGADLWTTRSLASTTLALSTADGVGGNPTINLSTTGTAGTYKSVTTDAYGRVIAGTNPTTLAGYGITDAVNVTSLGVANGVATLDSNGKLNTSQVSALAISDTFVVASQAAMLSLTNADVGDVAVRTDLNRSFILRSAPSSTLANWQELLTPTDAVLSVNGQTGAVTINTGVMSIGATAPAAGLTITGSPVTSSGTFTFALANDLAAVEGIATTGLAVRTAADTWATRAITGTAGTIIVTNGDGVAGAPSITLPTVGTAGTYKSVTTDAYGRITAGTNPTTLAGYGITDAQPLDSDLTALANLTTAGIYTNTGVGTASARTLTPASNRVAIVNGNGVSGDPTFDVVESNLVLNNISGVLSVAKGGTNLTALGTANQMLGVNPGATGLEYKTVSGTANQIIVSQTAGANTFALAPNPVFPGTGGVVLPTGTTAQRIGTSGTVRLNSTTGQFEAFNGSTWQPITTPNSLAQYFRGTVAPTLGTTIIPYGNTTPTSTQGTQLWSQTITPLDPSSYIEVQFSGIGDLSSTSAYLILSLFRGTTFIGMSILASGKQGADFTNTLVINIIDLPATTSPVTYSVRIGASAGTWYLGRGQIATFGNAALSHWSIKEYS